jgi:hypothetical protein
VFQHQQFRAFQFRQSRRFAAGIEKFHLEDIGREHFHDRADLSGDQAFRRFVFQQGYDIQQFDGRILHYDFIFPTQQVERLASP